AVSGRQSCLAVLWSQPRAVRASPSLVAAVTRVGPPGDAGGDGLAQPDPALPAVAARAARDQRTVEARAADNPAGDRAIALRAGASQERRIFAPAGARHAWRRPAG